MLDGVIVGVFVLDGVIVLVGVLVGVFDGVGGGVGSIGGPSQVIQSKSSFIKSIILCLGIGPKPSAKLTGAAPLVSQ